MSYELSRKPIGAGVHFSSVSDLKFKHNRISVNFIMPLRRETASVNAVVPYILRKGCRKCPDFSTLNARLAELYGAVLDADVTKYAAYQVLEVSIRGLDNRFALEGEDIAGECARLLAAVALDPNLGADGLFYEEDVALERQFLIDTIEAEINEKRSYAVSQCIQTMCEGEPVAVRRYGYRADAEAITPQLATEAYHRILKTAAVEVIFTGCGNPAAAEKVFTERFAGMQREPLPYEPVRLRTTASTVKEKVERMEIAQGKMVMGMRTGSVETGEQVYAMRVFAALFGGTPFSKLFMNVREKLSLCYYCASRFDVATKLLLVDSGVETSNKLKAQDEILQQLAAVQAGDFSEEELRDTKLLMKNSVKTMTDSLTGLEGWYLAQILRGLNTTPLEDTAGIDAVTREHVVAAARGITLDTVYFLTGPEQQANQGKE